MNNMKKSPNDRAHGVILGVILYNEVGRKRERLRPKFEYVAANNA